MHIVERHTSPDGKLAIVVAIGDDGEIAVGFDGGDWHTHTDLLAEWLAVPESQAIDRFLALVRSDQLPIVVSSDGGHTTNPWVPDNLPATVRMLGRENCILRYWSGRAFDQDKVL